jgi:hypothetical protein
MKQAATNQNEFANVLVDGTTASPAPIKKPMHPAAISHET